MSMQVPKNVKRRCQVKLSDPCIFLITTISIKTWHGCYLRHSAFTFVTVLAILVRPDLKPFHLLTREAPPEMRPTAPTAHIHSKHSEGMSHRYNHGQKYSEQIVYDRVKALSPPLPLLNVGLVLLRILEKRANLRTLIRRRGRQGKLSYHTSDICWLTLNLAKFKKLGNVIQKCVINFIFMIVV